MNVLPSFSKTLALVLVCAVLFLVGHVATPLMAVHAAAPSGCHEHGGHSAPHPTRHQCCAAGHLPALPIHETMTAGVSSIPYQGDSLQSPLVEGRLTLADLRLPPFLSPAASPLRI